MKIYKIAATVFVSLMVVIMPFEVHAYVTVKGYTRSDGTYVAPYVRSNPNGLKYDNYGYTPSQGLYNPSYGTRGSYWDTPTYITDPSYYTGLSLYNGGNISFGNSRLSQNKINIPLNATADYWGTGWTCNTGFTKNYLTNACDKVKVPANAALDFWGSGWVCNYGFSKDYVANNCKKVVLPKHATLDYWGTGWMCDLGYYKDYLADKCKKF